MGYKRKEKSQSSGLFLLKGRLNPWDCQLVRLKDQERCLGLAQRRQQKVQDAAETRVINISCGPQRRTGAWAWRLSKEAATKADKGRGSESKRKRRFTPFSAPIRFFSTRTLRLGPFDAHVASFWRAHVQRSTLREIFCTAETDFGGPLHRQQWIKGRPYARARHQTRDETLTPS